MLLRSILVLALLPVAELAILVWLARRTDLLTTIAVVLAAGFVGAAIARWQGLRAWRAIRSELNAGRLPAASAVDGLLILVAAALLCLPGLISDVAGFLLLLPPVRAAARERLTAYLRNRVRVRFESFAANAGGFGPRGEVIDAEFRRADAPAVEHRRGVNE